jgi:hypothetical protein
MVERERILYLLAHMTGDDDRVQRHAIEQRLMAEGIEPRAYMTGHFPELIRLTNT